MKDGLFFPDRRLTNPGKTIKFCAAVSKVNNVSSYNNLQRRNEMKLP